MTIQYPLQFEFQSNQSFDSFYPGCNTEIITHLQHFIDSGKEQQIYLWGASGLGKTHLLKACCQAANEQHKQVFYLDYHAGNFLDPGVLDGLENLDLVCLDNIEQIAGDKDWEQALFSFYNRQRDNANQLLIAASCPPQYLLFQLVDLKTRMNWGLTLKLLALSDEQMIQALIYKAHYMGFTIPGNVGRFLLTHFERHVSDLWPLLDKIDQATLAAKRKLTLPFLKQIIKEDE